MVTDFFIKIEGVDGESNEQNHSKWIEVVDFKHGSVQNIALGKAHEVSGRGQFTPFTFTHVVDKATPKLQNYCMTGQKINKVEFQVCRSIGGSQVPVYEITMENVVGQKEADAKKTLTDLGFEVKVEYSEDTSTGRIFQDLPRALWLDIVIRNAKS